MYLPVGTLNRSHSPNREYGSPMYTLYHLLLGTAILITLPYWTWRYFTTPKYRHTLRQRLALDLPDFGPAPRIWVHAVSVGEVMAARGLLSGLAERYPGHRIVLSTVTKTGQQVARQHLPDDWTTLYLPLDLPWIVNRVVTAMNPRFLVVMETELWPALFRALQRRHIPVLLANGRLSPNSSKNYRKVRWAMARFLEPVRLFAMQSEMDARRMREIGGDPDRIRTTGNIKYDQALQLPDAGAMAALEKRLARPEGPVWIAASTHPGEEEIILPVFQRLRRDHPRLKLILAPRHPERGDAIATLLSGAGLDFQRIAEVDGPWPRAVLLVDQVGWLTRLYGYARVAFVGGSLIPHGGQNMLEPAAWGVPSVFGPHTFNFKDASAQLVEHGAAIRIDDGDGLYAALAAILDDDARHRHMGRQGRAVVRSHAGALERTLEAIQQCLAAR